MSFAIQNPNILSIFRCLLKPEVEEGVLSKTVTSNLDFFILVIERSFGATLYMYLSLMTIHSKAITLL